MNPADYSVFEYLYRDAGNYKAWGELLLKGRLTANEIVTMVDHFEGGELFVAEQLNIPTLYEALWESCGSGPSEMDHVWHEFQTFRAATADEVKTMPVWGDAKSLVEAIFRVDRWDEKMSSNWKQR